MNAARLEKSKRLQDVYKLLKRRGRKGATSRELSILCDQVAIHSTVSEIRQQARRPGMPFSGVRIDCKCESRNPVSVYRYTLIGKGR